MKLSVNNYPSISNLERVIELPTRILGLLQSIEIDERPDKKLRQGFTGAPVLAAGWSKIRNKFHCSSPKERGELIPYMD